MTRRLVALLLTALLLTGCWSRLEINDLGLVLGMGVDVGEQEAVRLTLFFARSGQGGGGDGKGGSPSVWVVAREASNLSNALRAISLAAARRPTLNHLRVVLIGEEKARSDIRDVTDFLARHPQIRLSVNPLVVKGRAQTVLETPAQLRALQTDNISGTLEAKASVDWRLKDYLVARASDTHSGFMYMFEVVERPAGIPGSPTTAVAIWGAGLFRMDRMVATLDTWESQYFAWLLVRPKNPHISVTCPGEETGTLTAQVISGKSRIDPKLVGGKPSIQIGVEGRLNITRMNCRRSVIDPAGRKVLEEALNRAVHGYMTRLVNTFQETGTDPVGFGKRVQLRYRDYWRANGVRWIEIWPTVPVSVSVNLSIQESGLLIKPANLTEQEMGQ